jgi:hypothetical protein
MTDADARLGQLREEGDRPLASFTSEELVAVGADSPIQGLVTSERLASMGPIPLTAALSSALRSLVARGFVHLEGAAQTRGGPRSDRRLRHLLDALVAEEAGGGGTTAREVLSVPLSGDLAVVVALRRAPALVCLVSEPSRADLARRGPLAHHHTDAILHGFAEEGRLSGFLEERRSALGIHHFVLRSFENQIATLCAGLATRAAEAFESVAAGTSEVSLDVIVPGHVPRRGVRLLVVLETGDDEETCRISWPVGPGAPASETTNLAQLPERLGTLLEHIWRGDDGEEAMSAS